MKIKRSVTKLFLCITFLSLVFSHEHHDDSDSIYEPDYEQFVYKNDIYAGIPEDGNDFVEIPPSLSDECHFKTKINCALGIIEADINVLISESASNKFLRFLCKPMSVQTRSSSL